MINLAFEELLFLRRCFRKGFVMLSSRVFYLTNRRHAVYSVHRWKLVEAISYLAVIYKKR